MPLSPKNKDRSEPKILTFSERFQRMAEQVVKYAKKNPEFIEVLKDDEEIKRSTSYAVTPVLEELAKYNAITIEAFRTELAKHNVTNEALQNKILETILQHRYAIFFGLASALQGLFLDNKIVNSPLKQKLWLDFAEDGQEVYLYYEGTSQYHASGGFGDSVEPLFDFSFMTTISPTQVMVSSVDINPIDENSEIGQKVRDIVLDATNDLDKAYVMVGEPLTPTLKDLVNPDLSRVKFIDKFNQLKKIAPADEDVQSLFDKSKMKAEHIGQFTDQLIAVIEEKISNGTIREDILLSELENKDDSDERDLDVEVSLKKALWKDINIKDLYDKTAQVAQLIQDVNCLINDLSELVSQLDKNNKSNDIKSVTGEINALTKNASHSALLDNNKPLTKAEIEKIVDQIEDWKKDIAKARVFMGSVEEQNRSILEKLLNALKSIIGRIKNIFPKNMPKRMSIFHHGETQQGKTNEDDSDDNSDIDKPNLM